MPIIDYVPNIEKAKRAFFANDDLGSVLRAHFLLERDARHALSIASKGVVKQDKPKYLSQVIEILSHIGFRPAILSAATKVNDVRNRFAHDGTELIPDSKVRELRTEVGSFYPLILNDEYQTRWIDSKSDQTTFEKAYSDLYDRQKFVVLAMHLGAMLVMEAQYPGWRHDGSNFISPDRA